jgi:formate--tetrahydrofolate ligase
MARKISDYTVTEAGFGVDLGAEKFFHIKCRTGNLTPSLAVMVVTHRAFALHGIDNIGKHLDTLRRFGVPSIISINRFLTDSDADLREIRKQCEDLGAEAVITDYREAGGEGGLELAERVAALCEKPGDFKFLYPLEDSITDKVRAVATQVYGATRVEFSQQAQTDIKTIENMGFGNLPVCIAKTQSSLTDNPKIPGFLKDGFTITVSSARISAGAGFVVIFTGKILAMPGLPKVPSALAIDIDDKGNISGLF